MTCDSCGHATSAEAKFCPQCGAELVAPPPSREPPGEQESAWARIRQIRPDEPASFRSVSGIARWLIILLVAGALIDAVAVVSTLSQVALLQEVTRTRTLADGAAEANDVRQRMIASCQVVLYLVTAVIFLRWISRAYRNLGALSTWKTAFSPGWAIGSWFVPIINLVRPFRIVRETWWVSTFPLDADRSIEGYKPDAPAAMTAWWAMYLITAVLGQMVFRFSSAATTLPELLDLSYLSIVSDAAGIPTAILAIHVVRLISSRQDAAFVTRSRVSGGA